MRLFSLLGLCAALLFAPAALAQTLTATTEDGRAVQLFEDGSWRFASGDDASAGTAPAAGESTETPEEEAGTPGLLEGARQGYAVTYDPALWSLTDMFDNPSAEFSLIHQTQEAFLLVVPERIYIPTRQLADAAFENSLQTAPDLEILSRKNIEIDGREAIRMEMAGTSSGIPFTFLGYYYSDPDFGSLQLTGFTPTNLYDEYEPVLETVMRGLAFTDAD